MDTQSSSANRPKLWEKKLFADVMRGLYFMDNGMMGSDENSIIQIKTGLMKEKGDTTNLSLTKRLSGNGVDGDSEAEGNEEEIQNYSESVVIDQKRFPVVLKGKLDEQTNSYDMRTDAKNKLKIRITEFVERQFFLKLGGVTNASLTDHNGVTVGTGCSWSNTPDIVPNSTTAAGYGARYLCANYATGGGGAASMTSAHTLTPALITKAKTKAKLADPKVVPLRIKGKDYYLMFVHPWQADDLKNDATYNQARREAEVRGADNPIFTGALGVWDGVIIQEHEFVPFLSVTTSGFFNFGSTNSGTQYGTDTARAILVGCQAGVYAQCVNPNGWAEESKDYGNKTGFCTGLIGGIQKVQFNSTDYGVVTLDTAVTVQN